MKHDPNFDFYSFNFPNEEKQTRNNRPDPSEPLVSEQPPAHTPTASQPKTLPDPAAVRAMRHTYSRVGWAFVAMVVTWYATTIVFELIAASAFPALFDIPWLATLTGTLPLYVFGIPMLLLCMIGLPRELPQHRPFGAKAFFIALAVAVAAMIAGNLIGNTVMNELSLITGFDFSNMLEQTFDLPLWCSVLLTVVLAPIFEELIFRKLLLDRLLPFGEWSAILISAILFGAMHGNFYQFFYAVLIGLVLGYLYVRSGNWRLCVLLHLIINLVGGVLPTLILNLVDYDTLLDLLYAITAETEVVTAAVETFMDFIRQNLLGLLLLLGYEFIFYGTAVAGVILLIVHHRKIHFDPRPRQLPRGYRTAPAFLNSGVITALCLCGILFVFSLLSTAVPM